MMVTIDTARIDTLIDKYIEPHPAKPGFSNSRVNVRGVPVWALIGWLADDYSNAKQVAKDYAIPYEAMEAAIAFYERHKAVIDARLMLNREG